MTTTTAEPKETKTQMDLQARFLAGAAKLDVKPQGAAGEDLSGGEAGKPGEFHTLAEGGSTPSPAPTEKPEGGEGGVATVEEGVEFPEELAALEGVGEEPADPEAASDPKDAEIAALKAELEKLKGGDGSVAPSVAAGGIDPAVAQLDTLEKVDDFRLEVEQVLDRVTDAITDDEPLKKANGEAWTVEEMRGYREQLRGLLRKHIPARVAALRNARKQVQAQGEAEQTARKLFPEYAQEGSALRKWVSAFLGKAENSALRGSPNGVTQAILIYRGLAAEKAARLAAKVGTAQPKNLPSSKGGSPSSATPQEKVGAMAQKRAKEGLKTAADLTAFFKERDAVS